MKILTVNKDLKLTYSLRRKIDRKRLRLITKMTIKRPKNLIKQNHKKKNLTIQTIVKMRKTQLPAVNNLINYRTLPNQNQSSKPKLDFKKILSTTDKNQLTILQYLGSIRIKISLSINLLTMLVYFHVRMTKFI